MIIELGILIVLAGILLTGVYFNSVNLMRNKIWFERNFRHLDQEEAYRKKIITAEAAYERGFEAAKLDYLKRLANEP